jgi:dTDP-4-dehydrorhamnose 3,5-epimerase
MHCTPLAIPAVKRLQCRRFEDARGVLVERWQQAAFDAALGEAVHFVQDNQSHSRRGVLRGLHYQAGAAAQGKLVWAINGRVFDVAVDLRRGSASFGRWVAEELVADEAQMLWIPPGFAHGFYVMSETAVVGYKLTTPYSPAAARSLRWDDPALAVPWPTGGALPLLSAQDAGAPGLGELRLNELMG